MPFPQDLPKLEELLPHLPHEGPPVPRMLPRWPLTPADVEEATEHYRVSLFRAAENYRLSLFYAVEKYRISLMRRLPYRR